MLNINFNSFYLFSWGNKNIIFQVEKCDSMFYTEDRIKNWIERIKEEEVNINEGKGIDIFDKMLDDYIIACLNLLKSIKAREITKNDAKRLLKESKALFHKKYDVGDELKNELLEITLENMNVVGAGLELVIDGKISKKSFEKLMKDAIEKEKNGDIEGAFEDIVKMSAKLLSGEKLPENFDIPDEDLLVIGWLDAIDAINTINLLSEIDKSEVSDEDEDLE